jgi:hypothetical protein
MTLDHTTPHSRTHRMQRGDHLAPTAGDRLPSSSAGSPRWLTINRRYRLSASTPARTHSSQTTPSIGVCPWSLTASHRHRTGSFLLARGFPVSGRNSPVVDSRDLTLSVTQPDQRRPGCSVHTILGRLSSRGLCSRVSSVGCADLADVQSGLVCRRWWSAREKRGRLRLHPELEGSTTTSRPSPPDMTCADEQGTRTRGMAGDSE